MNNLTSNGALSGIRIADFSHVMAGPYASHLLRLMGAEVIKIEPKGGTDSAIMALTGAMMACRPRSSQPMQARSPSRWI